MFFKNLTETFVNASPAPAVDGHESSGASMANVAHRDASADDSRLLERLGEQDGLISRLRAELAACAGPSERSVAGFADHTTLAASSGDCAANAATTLRLQCEADCRILSEAASETAADVESICGAYEASRAFSLREAELCAAEGREIAILQLKVAELTETRENSEATLVEGGLDVEAYVALLREHSEEHCAALGTAAIAAAADVESVCEELGVYRRHAAEDASRRSADERALNELQAAESRLAQEHRVAETQTERVRGEEAACKAMEQREAAALLQEQREFSRLQGEFARREADLVERSLGAEASCRSAEQRESSFRRATEEDITRLLAELADCREEAREAQELREATAQSRDDLARGREELREALREAAELRTERDRGATSASFQFSGQSPARSSKEAEGQLANREHVVAAESTDVALRMSECASDAARRHGMATSCAKAELAEHVEEHCAALAVAFASTSTEVESVCSELEVYRDRAAKEAELHASEQRAARELQAKALSSAQFAERYRAERDEFALLLMEARQKLFEGPPKSTACSSSADATCSGGGCSEATAKTGGMELMELEVMNAEQSPTSPRDFSDASSSDCNATEPVELRRSPTYRRSASVGGPGVTEDGLVTPPRSRVRRLGRPPPFGDSPGSITSGKAHTPEGIAVEALMGLRGDSTSSADPRLCWTTIPNDVQSDGDRSSDEGEPPCSSRESRSEPCTPRPRFLVDCSRDSRRFAMGKDCGSDQTLRRWLQLPGGLWTRTPSSRQSE
mmetsp:Transcript_91965/g.259817  ORF Transcript_91965/g.259817 Transcript_91965/m.259817 type:complete len:759 (-) Transcript_91965:168-2444(-)